MIVKLAGVAEMVMGLTWNIPSSTETTLNDLGVASTSSDRNWDNCEGAAGGN